MYYAFGWTYGKNSYSERGGYNGSDPKLEAIGFLYRFNRAADRDAWVDQDDRRRETVTRKEAEKLAPRAFNDLFADYWGFANETAQQFQDA